MEENLPVMAEASAKISGESADEGTGEENLE